MALKDGLIPEFDAELASTRRVLERIPMDKASWKPHAKSFALGDLATHVVQMHTWVGETLRKDKIDMVGYARPTVPSTTAELLARFDEFAKDAREALAAATDEQMLGNWSLTAGSRCTSPCRASPACARSSSTTSFITAGSSPCTCGCSTFRCRGCTDRARTTSRCDLWRHAKRERGAHRGRPVSLLASRVLQRAAMALISTRYSGEASAAPTVARAGGAAPPSHASHASFISSNLLMSVR
jgi:hypothetical protein